MARLERTVTAEQNGRTVLSLLKGDLGLSAARIKRLKRTEHGLTVNGVRIFTNAVLHAGDRLCVDLDEAEASSRLEPVPMALDIRYEDEHLLVLNKAAPLAVIPSSLAPEEPALANGLAHYLGGQPAIHPVNRLDRGTTGLMVVAKNGWIHDRLRRQLHTDAFCRRYTALCEGVPDPAAGKVDLPIGRAPGSAIRRQIDPAGQPARTVYRVRAVRRGLSLVALTLQTGRTHQIRVHMAALGCPLAGDWLYGREDRTGIGRPALHAGSLVFRHPATGQRIALIAPLPEDMINLWER